MDPDLNLLEYLVGKGAHYIEESVEGTTYLPRTVIGVATHLLDMDGSVDLLTAKQKVTYEKFLKPLLFDVPCQGISGAGSCRGNGLVEAEVLKKCYFHSEFRCLACRAALAEKTG
ncbi:MAG: hypothetical protein A2X84_09995 [Desulfuromonadaceae bacterium GWC2_58_13]|nr:MAG: hypothetical protein A2X84_09995 [Desulfuromonadaceae bacterium GWC2_58_13]